MHLPTNTGQAGSFYDIFVSLNTCYQSTQRDRRDHVDDNKRPTSIVYSACWTQSPKLIPYAEYVIDQTSY